MTHEQDIEKIRAACIAANPEIVELKFGCSVHIEESVTPYLTHIIDAWNGQYGWRYKCVGSSVEYIAGDFAEIVGRPVRLADVLLAIEAKHGTHYKLYPSYDEPHHLVINDFHNLGRWNLRKDDINEQSDECISFIASLL